MKPDFLFVFLLLFIFSIACSNGSSHHVQNKQQVETPKRRVPKKPLSSFQDSLFIKSRAAIFFEPDSLQMEKIKTVNEKMVFESLTHDCFYQMQNARKVIDLHWKGVPVVMVSKIRWLIFRKSNKTDSIIDLNNVNYICGIYLFDPKKNPIRVDMTNIDTQLNFYFR